MIEEKIKEMIYDGLIEIKKACMISSYIMMSYTFLCIMLKGRCTWTEPNTLILYAEALFLALSWVGFFLCGWNDIKSEKLLNSLK